MDLIITILLPEKDIAHRLIIYENTLKAGGPEKNWIGINLGSPNASPENAEITLTRADGSKELAVISTGGSFSSQMPAETHFGLGKDQSVKSVHVTWPDGRTAQLENPTVNQWHKVKGQ